MEVPEVEKDSGIRTEGIQSDFVPGKPYTKLRRELSDEDLSHPAVQKLLINEIDKLEMRITDLEITEKKYFEVDKLKAVLEEKIKTHNSLEVLYSFCLTIGSAIMGLSSLFKIDETGWIFLVAGGILLIGGIFSKFVKWR